MIEPGAVLEGRYRIVRPLGFGGMGEVYEAEQIALGRRVALKLLFDDDEKSLARFAAEALALARLAHPNVVVVYDFHRDGARPMLVMELLEGESLHGAIVREGRFGAERAIEIARQMLDALGAAHRAGIVHRDVKPSNVFLVRDAHGRDAVKLLDFGLAKTSEGPRTTTGVVLGTAAYLAPEQISAQPSDARVDLRAVGLCLFEMLAARRPWRGGTAFEVAAEIMRAEPPTLVEAGVDVDPRLSALVARAVARDKAARFPDADAMLEALAALAAPATSTEKLPTIDRTEPMRLAPAPPPVSARTPFVHAAALAALLAFGLVVVALRRREPAHVAAASVVEDAAVLAPAPPATVPPVETSAPETSPVGSSTSFVESRRAEREARRKAVEQMLSFHAFGDTIDGAGCTCFPKTVLSDSSVEPLRCSSCFEVRVRGSGKCWGTNEHDVRQEGLYLCSAVLGPPPPSPFKLR